METDRQGHEEPDAFPRHPDALDRPLFLGAQARRERYQDPRYPDRDKTSTSREYIGRFSHIEYFDIVGYATTTIDNPSGWTRATLKAAIVIPKGFGADLKADRGADVQLIADGTDPLTAQVLVGYVSAITTVFSQEYILDALSQAGDRRRRDSR